MKAIRMGIIGVIAVLLLGGQAMSTYVALNPDGLAHYYQSLDNPAVKMLCWVLLLGAVAVGFVPDETEEQPS